MTRGTSLDDDVVRGRRGRLFLGRQDDYDLRAFRDGTLMPPLAYWRWRQTFKRRAAELAAIGTPYVLYIVPDAPSVYPEDLPAALDPGQVGKSTPLGARLAGMLRDIPNLTVVYPLDEMLEAKGGLPLYRKTDTHWSGYGAYVAYRAFCRAVAPLIPVHTLSTRQVRFSIQREFGDLGSLLEPEQTGFNPAIRVECRQYERTSMASGPDRTNSQSFRCDLAPPTRVLFLRDSFMTEQAPLMALSFAATEMVGTTTRLFLDHVLATRPDMVVTEICERRLGVWDSDHQLAGFEEQFGTDWVSDRGRAVLAVELALRQGNTQAAAAAAAPLLAQDTALEPGHAFTLARACLAANDAAGADRLAGQALAASPGSASLHCLAAQAKLGLNDGLNALTLGYAARELAPWNGFTHELLIYMLLTFDRPEEALEVFKAAAPRITDHPNLFVLGSMAADRCNERGIAQRAIRRAARLWPENEEIQLQLAALGAEPLDTDFAGDDLEHDDADEIAPTHAMSPPSAPGHPITLH